MNRPQTTPRGAWRALATGTLVAVATASAGCVSQGAKSTAAVSTSATSATSGTTETIETIVLLRHGEKPDAGLGQLSCQGLRRSLALPRVLFEHFGAPTAIFAPDPAALKDDRGTEFSYVRPLATIEPTAIQAGLPVNTQFGYKDTTGLEAALSVPALRGATVFVAWEHHYAENLARDLLAALGNQPGAELVPAWKDADFDSLYVVSVVSTDNDGKHRRASFRAERQGLDGLATGCPTGRF
jgi:hypothetical protein